MKEFDGVSLIKKIDISRDDTLLDITSDANFLLEAIGRISDIIYQKRPDDYINTLILNGLLENTFKLEGRVEYLASDENLDVFDEFLGDDDILPQLHKLERYFETGMIIKALNDIFALARGYDYIDLYYDIEDNRIYIITKPKRGIANKYILPLPTSLELLLSMYRVDKKHVTTYNFVSELITLAIRICNINGLDDDITYNSMLRQLLVETSLVSVNEINSGYIKIAFTEDVEKILNDTIQQFCDIITIEYQDIVYKDTMTIVECIINKKIICHFREV